MPASTEDDGHDVTTHHRRLVVVGELEGTAADGPGDHHESG